MKKLTIFELKKEHINIIEKGDFDKANKEEKETLMKIKLTNKEIKEGIYYKEEDSDKWKKMPLNSNI